MNEKKRILIVMGRYLPGFKTGGPVRSTKNIIDALGNEYDFRVLCQDRDLGDKEQYPNIKLYDWNQVGDALVYYIPEKKFTAKTLTKLSKEVDMIYMWGCFNRYTVKILWLKRLNLIKIPVVIAGMGLFSPKAFKIKYWKKKTVTEIMNVLGLFKNVYWSASTELERDDIEKQVWTNDEHIFIAKNLPRKIDETPIKKEKKEKELKIVWISRVSPKKNLLKAIEILKNVKYNVSFTIYGPIFDQKYWEKCEEELKKLPENIKWEYAGEVDSENVVPTLKKYHLFLFPTLGENYGHVIQEALSAGCVCILSDQTPWLNLEENNVGYALKLDENDKFVKDIEKYCLMNEEEFQECVNCALKYAIETANERIRNTGYRKIFDNL